MKFWQNIIINACVTALIVFVALGLFLPDASTDKTKEFQEALTKQIDGIQLKINAIEDAISNQSTTAVSGGPLDDSTDLSKLNQKIDMVLGKLAVLENRSVQGPNTFDRTSRSPMPQRQASSAPMASGRRLSSWFDELSEDKQQKVKFILEENAARLRDELPPPDPGGKRPDRELITGIMEENDQLLKQELKAVLSEEEYQRFLDSRPEPVVLPRNTRGIPENQ